MKRKKKDRESYILTMADTIMGNGKMIGCKGMASYIIKMEKLLTRAHGKMINLTEKEGFIISIQVPSQANSTTKTFQNCRTSGSSMTDNSKTIKKMEKAT